MWTQENRLGWKDVVSVSEHTYHREASLSRVFTQQALLSAACVPALC